MASDLSSNDSSNSSRSPLEGEAGDWWQKYDRGASEEERNRVTEASPTERIVRDSLGGVSREKELYDLKSERDGLLAEKEWLERRLDTEVGALDEEAELLRQEGSALKASRQHLEEKVAALCQEIEQLETAQADQKADSQRAKNLSKAEVAELKKVIESKDQDIDQLEQRRQDEAAKAKQTLEKSETALEAKIQKIEKLRDETQTKLDAADKKLVAIAERYRFRSIAFKALKIAVLSAIALVAILAGVYQAIVVEKPVSGSVDEIYHEVITEARGTVAAHSVALMAKVEEGQELAVIETSLYEVEFSKLLTREKQLQLQESKAKLELDGLIREHDSVTRQ
ncbi:MAG: hypothetical protein AAF226_01925, partial [Verrucomicrobiota bacterium]